MEKDKLTIRVSNIIGRSSNQIIDTPIYMQYNFGGPYRHEGFLVIQNNGQRFECVEINMNTGSVCVIDLVLKNGIAQEQLDRTITIEQMEKELKVAGLFDRWNAVKK